MTEPKALSPEELAEGLAIAAAIINEAEASPTELGRLREEHRRIVKLARVVAHLEAKAAAQGWLPIALCPTDGAWRLVKLPDGQEIVAAFDGVGITANQRWQTKTFFRHNPSRKQTDPQTGREYNTAPYDSYIIEDLKEGLYPTHFRPNDTVYGTPAPPSASDTEEKNP